MIAETSAALGAADSTTLLHRKRIAATRDVGHEPKGTFVVALIDFETSGLILDHDEDVPIAAVLRSVYVDKHGGRSIRTIVHRSDDGVAFPNRQKFQASQAATVVG